MHASATLEVGAPFPDLPLAAPSDTIQRLGQLRGSPVVVVSDDLGDAHTADDHVLFFNALTASLPGEAPARLLDVRDDGIWKRLTFEDGSVAVGVVTVDRAALAELGVPTPLVAVLDAAGAIRWWHAGPAPTDAIELARALTGACEQAPARSTWSRREFIATTLGVAVALVMERRLARAASVANGVEPAAPGGPMNVTLDVNDRELNLVLEPRVSLLDALREYAGLTGTKKGCDHGQCGACTVHVDGRRVLSCMTFAVMQRGKKITTIEGLAHGETLHPMQQAFITHDGFQCGYCTSGQIMSATGVLREPWGPGDDDVREAMSGNICRCGAYPGIVAAIQEVRRSGAGRGTR